MQDREKAMGHNDEIITIFDPAEPDYNSRTVILLFGLNILPVLLLADRESQNDAGSSIEVCTFLKHHISTPVNTLLINVILSLFTDS